MKNVKVVKNLFSLSTVMWNDWDLLTETRNNVNILKIKKGNIEYELHQKLSKNANGGYLMGIQIEPTKGEETKKWKMKKNQKKLKVKKKEILAYKGCKNQHKWFARKQWVILQKKW